MMPVSGTTLILEVDALDVAILQRALTIFSESHCAPTSTESVVASNLHERIGTAVLQAVKRDQTLHDAQGN